MGSGGKGYFAEVGSGRDLNRRRMVCGSRNVRPAEEDQNEDSECKIFKSQHAGLLGTLDVKSPSFDICR